MMNLQPATSVPSTGFTFGGGLAPQQPAAPPASVPQNPGPLSGTMSLGGLGGVPGTGGNTRISSLVMGADPGTGWSARNENKAVQELPVPPEVLALVEDLKNQMKNHKTVMLEITRATDLDIDTVAEQIEEVRLGINTLTNVIHKQELQSASLMKDMQEISKDVDLVSQSRDVPAYGGFGGTSNLVLNFMYDLLDKYAKRMIKYKTEIERAEFSLQTLVEASGSGLNAKDLWASLTATKDTVILLAAQLQQLNEDIRNELSFHKNLSNVLLPSTSKPWFANADQQHSSAPALEKLMATPTAKSSGGGANPTLDAIYNRTYSAFGRIPSVNFSQSYHPSAMGSYLGPTSPACGLKRSKK
ncbi:unnamed protein product [Orchesella dallaii]|uniref:Nucleoporin p58/p45 n=1 Tax=Orchesella dallaii TaxID=48710 RepID=A0ABP1PXJ6_9HEXA